MKQVLQNLRDGKTLVADVPIPVPQPGEALVRTAVSLVSAGTERMVVEFAEKSLLGKARSRPDLLRQVVDKARREGLLTTLDAAFNRLDQPMVLGYSSAGTIVRIGEDLAGFKIGDRVACAGGGYAVHAEYASVPKNLLIPIPETVDFESAAFTTLGAIALHGFRLAEVQLGERVAVIGLGLLGLLSLEIARSAGCQVLGIDIDPRRVALAVQLGELAVSRDQAVEAAIALTHGQGCDAVLICADTPSTDPVELAAELARDRARVIAIGSVGQELPRKIYYEKEITFLNSRSYGPGRYDPFYEEKGLDYPIAYVRWTEGRNLAAFVDLLNNGLVKVHSLISHRFPIEQAAQAYGLITGKQQEPFLGVLLTYPQFSGESADAFIPPEHNRVRVAQTVTRSDSLPLRLGVLGAGNFATATMLPAIKKAGRTEFVGIVSASGASAYNAAKRFGFLYAGSDEQQVYQDKDINTIAILTRHHLHANQVVRALNSGKHVFSEKPLCISPEQLAEIETALLGNAEQPKPEPQPILMVGFNRRFASLGVQLAEFFSGRQEPAIIHYRVNAGFLPPNHWTQDPAQGGGRLIGEACHFIDFLTFLVGNPPVNVRSLGLPDSGRYCEDNLVMTFSFPDGSIGTVSYLANGDRSLPKERIEVFSGGRVGLLDDYRQLTTIRNGAKKSYRSSLRQDKGHIGEWEAFIKAIQAGGPAPIPYEQIITVTRATFAAMQSLHTGLDTAI